MTITLREFVDREIIYCASSLISDLSTLLQSASNETLRQVGYSWEDDILPLLEATDYEEAGRAHIAQMDRDELIEALDDASVKDTRDEDTLAALADCAYHEVKNKGELDEDETFEDFFEDWKLDQLGQWPGVPDEQLRFLLEADVDEFDDGWKEFCDQQGVDTDDYKREAYEHWIVTDWLADKLSARGHVTGGIMGLTIWGRPTTGQSISMDHVIQEIYKELTGAEVTSADY